MLSFAGVRFAGSPQMASYRREVYEPSFEDGPTYELQDDDIEDGRARLPLLIMVALLVLAAFAGVVWLAYNQGVARGRAGAPVVIAAPDGPVRTAPAERTAEVPYTGLKVYGQPVSPAEEAQASALAQEPAARIALPPPPTAAVAPVAAPPPPAVLSVPDAKPAAPLKLASEPAPKPKAVEVPVETPKAVAPATRATEAKPAAAPGQTMLQIGAYPTRELAEAAWQTFKARHAGVLGSLSDDVQMADLGGKGIWYRLRVGPFAQKSAAGALCDRLKSEGANCFVAAP